MAAKLEDILVVTTSTPQPETVRDTIRGTIERELLRLGISEPKVLVVPPNISLTTIVVT